VNSDRIHVSETRRFGGSSGPIVEEPRRRKQMSIPWPPEAATRVWTWVSVGVGPYRLAVGARSGRWRGDGTLNWWRAMRREPRPHVMTRKLGLGRVEREGGWRRAVDW
jgi:hypothetical protein